MLFRSRLVELFQRKAQQVDDLVRQRAQLIVSHGLDTLGHVWRQSNIDGFWLWLIGHIVPLSVAKVIIEVYAIVSKNVAIDKECEYNQHILARLSRWRSAGHRKLCSVTHGAAGAKDTTVKIGKVYSSKFLKAADIDEMADEATQTAIVAIDRVEMEEIGQDQQQKPVVYFRDIEPGLVLNKTNAGTLAKLLGDETDEWSGKKVGLFTTEVDYAGQQVLAIRVRLKLPKAARPAPVVDDAEIPF